MNTKPYFYWISNPAMTGWIHDNPRCLLTARLEGWDIERCTEDARSKCMDSSMVACFVCKRDEIPHESY